MLNFSLVLDVLTKHIQDTMPKCMLFANDIVLIAKSQEDVNGKLEMWREALESKGFHLSRNKTEYMECKFNKRPTNNNLEVKIGEYVIPKVSSFRYLGSIIQSDKEINKDVTHSI